MIPASELETPRTIEEYNAAVGRVRQQSAKRRSRAWICVSEGVLGLELNPVTPAILSLLSGVGSAFLSGQLPSEEDVRNFVWFCSPLFNPDTPVSSLKWKPLQMFRLRSALRRRERGQSRSEAVLKNFIVACMEINAILSAAFADGLPAGDGDSRALAASLEAQLTDLFAREYKAWPLSRPVRHTPIKQLFQLARCIDRRHLGRDDRYYDPQEWTLDRAFLASLNPGK